VRSKLTQFNSYFLSAFSPRTPVSADVSVWCSKTNCAVPCSFLFSEPFSSNTSSLWPFFKMPKGWVHGSAEKHLCREHSKLTHPRSCFLSVFSQNVPVTSNVSAWAFSQSHLLHIYSLSASFSKCRWAGSMEVQGGISALCFQKHTGSPDVVCLLFLKNSRLENNDSGCHSK
jgi:hypothetical protein